MSLISGKEWEGAVSRTLAAWKRQGGPSWERTPAQVERAGSRVVESAAGPADFRLIDTPIGRVPIECKVHSTRSAKGWPLSKLKPSQASDLGAAPQGLVLLRYAHLETPAPDIVVALPWASLGPVWEAWRDKRKGAPASLTFRRAIALEGATWAIVSDSFGAWNAPLAPIVDALPKLS